MIALYYNFIAFGYVLLTICIFFVFFRFFLYTFSLMISTYIVWFMIYSFIGWIYESGLRTFTNKHWYNSGFLNGPYVPIYGFGAILDLYFLGGLKDPLQIFFCSAIINCLLEYLTSYVMEKLFHARWWDYSRQFLNINGRVCLLGFVVFGSFAAAVILYFHPWLKSHTTDLMNTTLIDALAFGSILLLSTDTCITISALKGFKEKVQELTFAMEEIRDSINANLENRMENSQLIERFQSIRNQLNAQQKRLIRAFPDLRFEDMKYTAEEIRQMIIDNNKKLFHLK